MSYTAGVLLYDDFELLDLAGAYGVLAHSRRPGPAGGKLFSLHTVARTKESVRFQGDMEMMAEHIFPDAHVYDVLLVPGGIGAAAAVKNLRTVHWVRRAAQSARFVGAVGSGILVLAVCGLLAGKQAAKVVGLATADPSAQAVATKQVVQDGKILTVAEHASGGELGLAIVEAILQPAAQRA